MLLAFLPGADAGAQNSAQKNHLSCDKPTFSLQSEGLSSPVCLSMIQDHEGFVWIGTANGVTRYDGIHIHNFGNLKTGLRVNGRRIVALTEDTTENCIWASMDRETTLMRIDRGSFNIELLDYKVPDGNGADSYRVAMSLTCIDDSTLLCRLSRGFYTINKRTGYASLIKPYKSMVNSSRTPFFSFMGGVYNVGGGRIFKVESEENGVLGIETGDFAGLTNIKDAAIKDDTTLVILTMVQSKDFELHTYNGKSGKATLLSRFTATPHGIACADDGVWIATNTGLGFIRYDDARFELFTSANSTLHDNDLSCIIKAANQHIFFIGSGDGLITLNYFNSKFTRTDMRRYSTSSNPQVWSIAKDSHKNYWIGCLDGLYRLRENSIFYSKIPLPTSPDRGNTMLMDIHETVERDGIIVSTPWDVFRVGYDGQNARCLLHDGDMVRNTRPIPGGRIVVTRRRNISIISATDGRVIKSLDSDDRTTFTSGHTDDMKTLWVTTNNQEIDGFDLETLEKKYIIVLPNDSIGAVRTIRHNVSGGMDELWIATTNGGLLYKNPGYAGVMPVDGSPMLQARIHSMELDKNGSLWVSTDAGIVNISDGVFTDYPTAEYNLCSRFINQAAFRGPDGEILMGGRNDFLEFTPHEFTNNDYFPTPIVTTTQLYNFSSGSAVDENLLGSQLYGGGTFVIPPGVVSMMVNVRCMSYDHSGETNVEWMIDNDHEWKKSQANGDILLTDLSEGEHHLYFRSTDDNGAPQAGVGTMTVIRKMVFYESKMFIFVVVGLIIAIVAALWGWTSYQARKIKKKLIRDVNSVSDMLVSANNELRKRQAEIKRRNEEISAMNSNLQTLVEQRTKELAVAKAKAEESSQLKSDFLASLGHEVRTPMNAIVGFARLLQTDDCPPEERSEFASLILKSANSLLSLLSALLDSSRIERGVLEISMTETDLGQELNDAYRILSVEKKNPNVKFLLEMSDDINGLVVMTDKERLRQVLINLTYNAFKFTESGYVKIAATTCSASDLLDRGLRRLPEKVSAYDRVVMISVEDTGIGIPEDKTEIIFEPFRRLTGNTMKHPGLGLGLNIVKNLVNLMGGSIWLKSVVEKGSTFYFFLPTKK